MHDVLVIWTIKKVNYGIERNCDLHELEEVSYQRRAKKRTKSCHDHDQIY